VSEPTEGNTLSDGSDLSLYTTEQKLDMLAKQVDWLCSAVTQIGNITSQTQGMFTGVVNALMASPMGGAIRKQMEGLANGRN
jgi:hypothetical protein